MELKFEPLGKYVHAIDERNTDLITESVLGINIDKYFMPSVANVIGTDLRNYKLLRKGRFACNPMHVGRDGRLPVARYTENIPAIVSPAYFMFEIINENDIEPEYLMLCFRRSDFDRMCSYRTDSSVRGGITWDDVCALTIPVPSLTLQRKIVQDYQIIIDRISLLQKIDENLAEQMKSIYRYYFIDYEPFKEEPFHTTKIGKIPSSWKTGKLSEVCEMLNGRAYSQDEMLTEGKYKLLRVGNFFTNDFWYYSNLELDENKYCYPGDLLFCWAATLGLYIWNEPKTIYHYHIWKVDFSRSSPLYKEYIYLCLSNEIENMKHAGHGSIMLHLTKENVENMEIVLPATQVIEEFHRIIEPYLNYKNIIQKELDDLSHLKTEMLTYMLS